MPPWESFYMLREDGFIAFSQNLITDTTLIKRLINKSDISISDKILEIGAGKGSITEQLSKACGQVIAVEIDKNYFKKLADRIHSRNVTLINNDILKVTLPTDTYKVFSNIPFNFTSRIMNKLYFQDNPPQASYIVMQKEASQIYTGIPRETQRSLLLKPFYTFDIFYTFQRTDFKPTPSIDAVMLHINKKIVPQINEPNKYGYYDFVVYGTTRYKSTLKKSLNKIFTREQFKRLSVSFGFSIHAKPLDLTVEQWVALSNYFDVAVAEQKKLLVTGAYKKQRAIQNKINKRYRTRRI